MAFAIGTIVLGGLIGLCQAITGSYIQMRQDVAIHGNLQMAKEQILDHLLELEPDFWTEFPRTNAATCELDHRPTPAVDISRSCTLDHTDGLCITFWNLTHEERSPDVYKISDHHMPSWLELSSLDESSQAGPGPEIGAMSVLFVSDGLRHMPLLVDHVEATQVFLREGEDHPWLLADELDWDAAHVVHMATLKLRHMAVASDKQREGRLNLRPISMTEDGWTGGRTSSSYLHLKKFESYPSANGNVLRLIYDEEGRDVFIEW